MGARPSTSASRVGNVRLRFGLLVSVLLLLGGASAANKFPKFPRSHSKVKSSETLALHPSSTRTDSSQANESAGEQTTAQSKEVTKGTTLSALNLGSGEHDTSQDQKEKPKHLMGTQAQTSHPKHLVGTQGVISTSEKSKKASEKVTEKPDEKATASAKNEKAASTEKPEKAIRWDPFSATEPHSAAKDEGLVIIKSRLRPADVLNKAVGKNQTLAEKAEKMLRAHKHSKHNTTELRKKRSKTLDLVITHYDPARSEQMVDFWLNFLQLKKVRELKPYVFIYCQNEHEDFNEDDFKPILQLGGEVIHLPNIGRESHSYLGHITSMYEDLANHTLFAQDISSDQLPDRFEAMFEEKTGFLPLSLVGHVDCESGQTQDFLPPGMIPQIYSMFAEELCPPVGYTSSFEGQFVVSKQRVRDHTWWVYRRLLDLLSADENHWIHDKHSNEYYKRRDNPMFGHVLERTWSVAFNCFESWREGNCWECIERKGMRDCGPGACQCYDA